MDLRRSQTARQKAMLGNRGESRAFYTLAWPYWHWGWSSTSWAPGTRVSKRQRCAWWVLHLSSQACHFVYCVSPFVYLPSLAADGGPTTRRTEDCPAAWKGRRCRWPAGGRARGRRSARRRGAWTPPRATSPASPAARRTSACGGTAPRRTTRCTRPGTRVLHTRARHSRVRYARVRRRRARRSPRRAPRRARKARRRRWRRRRRRPRIAPASRRRPCPARCTSARPRGARRLATCPSPAAPTASSSSAPPNSAPNPRAIKVVHTSFYYSPNDGTLCAIRFGSRLCDSVTLTVFKCF